MTSIVNRMIRAAKLDAQLYEEVEADKENPPVNKTGNPLSSKILALIGSCTPGTISDLSPCNKFLSVFDVFTDIPH